MAEHEWQSADKEHQHYLDAADTSHWAYRKGYDAGMQGNRSERGLMRFGLSFAGDAESAANTRQWLAGFHAGLKVYCEKGKPVYDRRAAHDMPSWA